MSFHSPFPDVEIPDTSLFDFLLGRVATDEKLAAKIALIDGSTGAETTYGQLVGQINALAGALAQRGFGVGDVAGILCPNLPAFVTVFHGILRSGGTATTINSLYTAGDITSQLKDSKAGYLFTISLFLPQAEEAAAAVGMAPENIVVIDGFAEVAPERTSLRELLGAGAPAPKVTIDSATHLAVLPYSSGTTGRAKGVMLTHRNLIANVAQTGSLLTLSDEDRLSSEPVWATLAMRLRWVNM